MMRQQVNSELQLQLHDAAKERRRRMIAAAGIVKPSAPAVLRLRGPVAPVAPVETALIAAPVGNGFGDYRGKDETWDKCIIPEDTAEWTEKIPGLRVRRIIEVVAFARMVHPLEMLSSRRWSPLVEGRQEAMWLAWRHTVASLPKIGQQMNNRDHTTVLHGVRAFVKKMEAGTAKRTVYFNRHGRWFPYVD